LDLAHVLAILCAVLLLVALAGKLASLPNGDEWESILLSNDGTLNEPSRLQADDYIENLAWLAHLLLNNLESALVQLLKVLGVAGEGEQVHKGDSLLREVVVELGLGLDFGGDLLFPLGIVWRFH